MTASVLIMALIGNLIVLIGLPTPATGLVTGLIVLMVVGIDAFARAVVYDAVGPGITLSLEAFGPLRLFDPKNMMKDFGPVQFHPGAVKYFAEKGIKLN